MVTPILGSFLFSVFGKSTMLDNLKKNRFKDDLVHAKENPELVNGLVERIGWMIEHKEGFTTCFQSTLQNFPFVSGCKEILESIGKNDTKVLLLWVIYFNSLRILNIVYRVTWIKSSHTNYIPHFYKQSRTRLFFLSKMLATHLT
jgi:hypothetical protein